MPGHGNRCCLEGLCDLCPLTCHASNDVTGQKHKMRRVSLPLVSVPRSEMWAWRSCLSQLGCWPSLALSRLLSVVALLIAQWLA